jgi:spoIIIJ-associated protein
MDMITISAKSLDEAVTKALIELQTTSEHLHYEVVQKESAGVFGIFGAKPCVIRARVMGEEEERALKKAAADKAKAEKAAQAEKERAEKEAAKAAEKSAAAAAKAEEPKAEAPAAEEKKESKEHSEKKHPEKKNAEHKRQERRDGGHKERPERQNRRNEAPVSNSRKPEEEKPVKTEKEKQPVKADPEKVQNAAKTFLVDVFAAMGMEVSVETVLDLEEGELQVMMSGDDMGILIGKRGQTLDSLQYLVSLVVNKETEGYLRVKLDTENYRERRKETLETLARNISYKVKRTKRPVSLEPMNPYERRIIHSALQNDRYVVTRSEGEDPYRHVVISLKNDRYSGGRDKRYGSRRDRGERRFDKQAEKTAETAAETVKAENEEA